jgi:hypothetical protein
MVGRLRMVGRLLLNPVNTTKGDFMEQYITAKEAAVISRVSEQLVRRHCAQGADRKCQTTWKRADDSC